MELTPTEINLKVETYNKRQSNRNLDISDLSTLIALGINNPKEFKKVLKKFRLDPLKVKAENLEMKRQAGVIGARIPE